MSENIQRIGKSHGKLPNDGCKLYFNCTMNISNWIQKMLNSLHYQKVKKCYITDLNCKIIINIYKILRFIIDYIFTIKRCVLYYNIIYVCITATIQLYISFQRNLGDLSRGQNLRL